MALVKVFFVLTCKKLPVLQIFIGHSAIWNTFVFPDFLTITFWIKIDKKIDEGFKQKKLFKIWIKTNRIKKQKVNKQNLSLYQVTSLKKIDFREFGHPRTENTPIWSHWFTASREAAHLSYLIVSTPFLTQLFFGNNIQSGGLSWPTFLLVSCSFSK